MRNTRTGRLADFLLTHQGRRVSKDVLRDELTGAAARVGLGQVTPHQLRHTFATALVHSEVSLQTLVAMLGHYAGDCVKWFVSGCGLVEPVEQPIEDLLWLFTTKLGLAVGVLGDTPGLS